MTSSPPCDGAAMPVPLPASRISRFRPLTLCMIAALPLLTGCTYVDRARRGSDLIVGVAEHYKLEALVQADIERQRIRAARCYSPLLTPATISAAATDGRLGPTWVDGLLRDCPQFGAFLSELMVRRARAAGLVMLPTPATQSSRPGPEWQPQPQPTRQDLPPSAEPFGGEDDGGVPFEAVEP